MKSIRPAFDIEKRISKEAQEQSDMIGLRQKNEELKAEVERLARLLQTSDRMYTLRDQVAAKAEAEVEELRVQLSQMMTACNMHRNDCIAYKNEVEQLKEQIAEAYRLGESVLEALAPVDKSLVEKAIDRSPPEGRERVNTLSPMDVKEAEKMRKEGATYLKIAEHFGVSDSWIHIFI